MGWRRGVGEYSMCTPLTVNHRRLQLRLIPPSFVSQPDHTSGAAAGICGVRAGEVPRPRGRGVGRDGAPRAVAAGPGRSFYRRRSDADGAYGGREAQPRGIPGQDPLQRHEQREKDAAHPRAHVRSHIRRRSGWVHAKRRRPRLRRSRLRPQRASSSPPSPGTCSRSTSGPSSTTGTL